MCHMALVVRADGTHEWCGSGNELKRCLGGIDLPMDREPDDSCLCGLNARELAERLGCRIVDDYMNYLIYRDDPRVGVVQDGGDD